MGANAYLTEASQREMAYPGMLKYGMRGSAVKRLQEWACWYYDTKITVDGEYGAATARCLQAETVTEEQWGQLTRAMQVVLTPPSPLPQQLSFSEMLRMCAKTHLGIHPAEVGGQNRGPWVRLYMAGREGRDWPWCAGFVSFLMRQTEFFLGVDVPIAGSYSSSVLAANALDAKRLVSFGCLPHDTSAAIFLVQGGKTGYKHTGVAYDFDFTKGTFLTIEGNSNTAGSSEGKAVCSLVRSASGKDFIILD